MQIRILDIGLNSNIKRDAPLKKRTFPVEDVGTVPRNVRCYPDGSAAQWNNPFYQLKLIKLQHSEVHQETVLRLRIRNLFFDPWIRIRDTFFRIPDQPDPTYMVFKTPRIATLLNNKAVLRIRVRHPVPIRPQDPGFGIGFIQIPDPKPIFLRALCQFFG